MHCLHPERFEPKKEEEVIDVKKGKKGKKGNKKEEHKEAKYAEINKEQIIEKPPMVTLKLSII